MKNENLLYCSFDQRNSHECKSDLYTITSAVKCVCVSVCVQYEYVAIVTAVLAGPNSLEKKLP